MTPIETAGPEEWEDFESGSMADVEEWLADHHDHPLAAEGRKMADDHLSVWLRGSRGRLARSARGGPRRASQAATSAE